MRGAAIAGLQAACVTVLLLSGCASQRPQPDGSISYTYSTFDFSGDAWKGQQQRCAAEGKKPIDLGTECGFWNCTSRLGCQ
jgi:hypothetical protein